MTEAVAFKDDVPPPVAPEVLREATDLLRARYGSQTIAVPDQWNDTLSILLSHRSVRAYLPEPLPPGALETIIAAAQSAATSSNLQAWSVIAVEDKDRKARLATLAGRQKHIEQAPLFLVFLADLARLDKIAEDQGGRAGAHDYLESFVIGVIDAALAAQNAVVALESLGLGSVYIGGIRNHPEEVAAELGLPKNVLAVFGLCVGTPAALPIPSGIKPRLPQRLVLHRERYDEAIAPDVLADYNRDLREFQKQQGMGEADWTQQAVDRMTSVDALKSRGRLTEALRTLGFGLR